MAAIEAFAKTKSIKSKRFAGVDQAQTICQGPPSLGLSKTCKIFLLIKERNNLLPSRIMLEKRIQTRSGRVMIKTLFTSGHGDLQSITAEFDQNVPRTVNRFRFNYQWNQ